MEGGGIFSRDLAVMSSIDPSPSSAVLREIAYADLPGWADALLAPTFAAFRRHAERMVTSAPKTRGLGVSSEDLVAVAASALKLPEPVDEAAARAFFETHFTPRRVEPSRDEPFLTGYFEPELDGSRHRSDRFSIPLLARPDDLVDIDDASRPGFMDPSYAFARRTADGLVPYFTRGEIDDGALAERGLELVWLEDPVDAFFVHVQGSVRIRLAEGGILRLAYDGKAGHPYTSIGRIAIDRGMIPAAEMTLDRLREWLRADVIRARALMRENRSYVFFREQPDLDPDLGAAAAAGMPLTPGISLAVDRTLHTYGSPVFVDADLPLGIDGEMVPFRRLMLAQDTGSAIVGPARGDVFVGLGVEAGRRAGRIRHVPRAFVLLMPKPASTRETTR